ncbi:MAG TPA: hypothetical protein VFU30_05155 [Gaiellaceae bacterium]|nr:hypothetical protein [Gaiellaceae bacterium]
MDAHAIEVGAGALVIAAASGFAGAYLGAWTTARHDRIERARTRRIEAADDLVQAWAAVLFALDEAIQKFTAPIGLGPDRVTIKLDLITNLQQLITAAVTLSIRVDLLFSSIGLAAKNEDALRDQSRAAVGALLDGNFDEARRLHAAAAMSQAWLVNTLAEAIDATGTRRDVARQLRDVSKEPESDPANRLRDRG